MQRRQFKIRHALLLTVLVAFLLAIARWAGFLQRDGVWVVTNVSGELTVMWDGYDLKGNGIWGDDVIFSATCRDGRELMKLPLATYSYIGGYGGEIPTALPLSVGDRFRLARSRKVPNAVKLENGTTIVMIDKAE